MEMIKQAAQIIESGGVVALPTDSCYALVCQLDDKGAVERLRRRHVDDMQPALDGPFFRQRALARTGSANDQFFHGAQA